MSKISETRTLLFMPDISGFTRFVKQTEQEHSQHIIQELLEILIDSNELGLKLNEIEGDALFFYKEGSIPELEKIEEQARKMFIKFHNHLLRYERDRICDCGACATAHGLSLKIIAHSGDVRIMNIKDRLKLYGTDVIALHALLKNSIKEHQYLLLTEELFRDKNEPASEEWVKSTDSYPEIGQIGYRYKSLKDQLEFVKLEPRESIDQYAKNSVVATVDIDAPIDLVHKTLTDLDIKKEVFDELIDVKYDKKEIPRVGAIHQCILPNFVLNIEISENKLQNGTRVYAEKIDNFPLFKRANMLYTMTDKGGKTKLTLQLQIPSKSFFKRISFVILKMMLKKEMRKKAGEIKQFAEMHSKLRTAKGQLQVG